MSTTLSHVVLAKARTHYHRPSFGEDQLTPCRLERSRGMGPGFRQDDNVIYGDTFAMVNFYGKSFASRLLIGSALYPSPAIMQSAIRASGAGIVTVSLRREAAGGKTGDAFWKLI